MKTFSIILAVLVLFLSGIPCDDLNQNNDGELLVYSQSNSHDDHGDHQNSDACSPFCACQCCQSSAVPLNPILNAAITTYYIQKKPSYRQVFYPNGIIYSIWRPPQLS